jgi:hypothetical protein
MTQAQREIRLSSINLFAHFFLVFYGSVAYNKAEHTGYGPINFRTNMMCHETHFGPTTTSSLVYITWGKVHSTTLIYRRRLSFIPQPQNHVLHTHKLSKPSDLPPSVDFEVVFAYVAPRQGGFRICGATSAILVVTSAGPTCHLCFPPPRRQSSLPEPPP